MKTILEATKLYPQEFITTIKCRAESTPSRTNKFNHIAMYVAISVQDWGEVIELLNEPFYRKPLEGVIFCLERYSEMDKDVWFEITKLWEDGRLV